MRVNSLVFGVRQAIMVNEINLGRRPVITTHAGEMVWEPLTAGRATA